MQTRKRNSAFSGLVVLALIVLAAPVVAQDFGEFMKCEICSAAFKDMELIASCDYAVHDWSHGTVTTLELNNPALMQKFRDSTSLKNPRFENIHERKFCKS